MHSPELSLIGPGVPAAWAGWTGPRPNLLFVSADPILDRVVSFVLQSCSPPFHFCSVPGELLVPETKSGTLILADVAELTPAQQIELNEWIGGSRGNLQIVSLTAAKLETLVERGQFLDALYYRLNVVRLDIDVHREVGPLA